MTTIAVAARSAYDAGLCVCPPREDGSKAPQTRRVTIEGKQYHIWAVREFTGDFDSRSEPIFKTAMPPPDQVASWYGPCTGLGAAMGKVSGNAEFFEFDDRDTYVEFLRTAKQVGLGGVVDRIQSGYEEQSPSGGIHWVYRCDEVGESTKLAQRPAPTDDDPNAKKTLIETKGDGGYGIFAPTNGRTHPSGRPYVLLSGGFETIVDISLDERRDLFALARTFDEVPISEPHRPTSTARGEHDGLRPGDIFSQQTTWPEVLKPHGWTQIYARGDVGYWRRPGKASGISATTNRTGRDTFINFSTSTPFHIAPSSYDRFGVYTVLNHGGDWSAAAKALNEQGYHEEGPKWHSGNGAEPPVPDSHEPSFPRTDVGNAEVIAYLYRGQVRFDHRRARWLLWAEDWWKEDETAFVVRLAIQAARWREKESQNLADLEERQKEASWAISSENRNRLEAALELARSLPPIADNGDGWDAKPWLLGVLNGVVDLRTGESRAGLREDKITKHAPVAYDPIARCPLFDSALARAQPEPEMRDYLQRRAGYALTGDVGEQDLAFWHGPGANGKTTVANALMDALGRDYAKQAAPGLLLRHHGDHHPTEIADLDGARLVVSTEVDDGRALAEEFVKQITGGDRLKARKMRENFWEFDATFKIVLLANHKPVIRGTDYAIWRRMKLVPWSVIIPPAERDPHLREKLRGEASGILNWMIAGCLDWQRNGMQEPDGVTAATESYRADSDELGAFIDERCVLDERFSVGATALYHSYQAWTVDQGMSERERKSTTAFGRAISDRFERRHTREGRVYVGIGLLSEHQDGLL